MYAFHRGVKVKTENPAHKELIHARGELEVIHKCSLRTLQNHSVDMPFLSHSLEKDYVFYFLLVRR